jgi:pseudaminic acid cytidylyltransferase
LYVFIGENSVKMKSLAIIPARGGSKRIPGKNVKSFVGLPIIAYSIKNALKSNVFDEIMVSTDDDAIAQIAKEYGAQVPFLRSPKTSDDHATLADVIEEVILTYATQGKKFEHVCCLLPTAPFITSSRIKDALIMLTKKEYDSVLPVVRFSYPIQRALKIEEGKLNMIWPENISARSQDLMPTFHDSGQFYWLNVNRFLETKKIFTSNTGAIILSDLEVQDIDTEDDWKIAEMKYKLINPE